MSGYERKLLARARELADTEELAATVCVILGGARNAGLDPEATTGLTGAAMWLGADTIAVYRAGAGTTARYADDHAFIGHVADTEDDTAERLQAARRLRDAATAALDAAGKVLDGWRRHLAAAYAMPVKDPCDGCHGVRADAIETARAGVADAEARVALCEAAIDVLDPLIERLRRALARLRSVPADLGETYESVYNLIRRGGRMPHRGRWIQGEGTVPAAVRTLAVAPLAAALAAFPAIAAGAPGSTGAGIQAAAECGAAPAGHTTALPAVYVVNTGSGTETLKLSVIPAPRPRGALAVPPSWVTFSPGSVQVAAGGSATVPVTLDIPAGATRGQYRARIEVVTAAPAGPGGTGVSVAAGGATWLAVAVGGTRPDCPAGAATAPATATVAAAGSTSPAKPLAVRAAAVILACITLGAAALRRRHGRPRRRTW
jgi:hypothetical protein